jgi:hypothetical protein
MIRMLFAMFVTLAGFAAVALWMARGGDAREVVREILPEEVQSAVRSEVRKTLERFDLEEVASRLPRPAPNADASGDASAPADATEQAESTRTDAIAAPEAGQAAEPQPAVVAGEAVEERELSPRAEFARDLGAAANGASGGEDGDGTQTVAASAPSWGEDATPARVPDQDEWASLIRRMLAVYHQTGAVE